MLVSMARPQISLLSVIVVVLLAGALLGINVAKRSVDSAKSPSFNSQRNAILEKPEKRALLQSRGWPRVFEEWYDDEQTQYYEFHWITLILNIIFCACLLVIAAYLVEALIWRRRKM